LKNLGNISLKLITAKHLKMLRPKEAMSVADFCDKYRYLSPETAESPGPWRTDAAPYTREVLNIYTRRQVRKIILKWGVQLAKTEIMLCLLLWIFVRRPGSTMVVYPKKDTAKNEFSAKRLKPMLRDCPVLKDVFPEKKRGRFIDTKDQKTYVGGSLKIAGTSVQDLCSTPVRDIFVDEVSRCAATAGNEGDVFDLAEARQSNFFDAKTMYTSTPTEEGTCHITRLYAGSRQHVYLVPCPHCDGEIELIWENGIVWEADDKPDTARYRCQLCEGLIDESHKMKMLRRGRWSCVNPEVSEEVMGYHLSTLYSPWVSWSKLVKQYIEARNELQRGNEEKMKTFVNTRLARAYLAQTEGVDDSSLWQRREIYRAEAPEPVLFVTAGVDVNSNNLCVEVVGWGEDDVSYSIDYRVFHGDPQQTRVWKELEDYLKKPIRHEFGFYIGIDAVGIDQGYLQKIAEAFVKTHEARRFFAFKGEKGWGRPIVGDPYRIQKGKGARKVPLYPLCDSEAKLQIYSDLRREDGPRSCHFPFIESNELNPYGKKFFQELVAERIRIKSKRGFDVREWHKPSHVRNEPLDCRKLAMGAKILIRPLYAQKRELYKKRALEFEAMVESGMPEMEAALFWLEGRNKISSPSGKPKRPKGAGGSSWVRGW
jgi:phage terminase large subunit GpA-like protein